MKIYTCKYKRGQISFVGNLLFVQRNSPRLKVWFPLPSPTGQSTLSALLCQQMQPHHTISSPFFSEVPASFAELGNFYKRANIMHKIFWRISFVSIKYPLFYPDTQSNLSKVPIITFKWPFRSQKTKIVNIEYLGRVKSSLLKKFLMWWLSTRLSNLSSV